MADDWPGLTEAINIAVAIGRGDGNAGVPYRNMTVTHSPEGEYNSSYDVIAVKKESNDRGSGTP